MHDGWDDPDFWCFFCYDVVSLDCSYFLLWSLRCVEVPWNYGSKNTCIGRLSNMLLKQLMEYSTCTKWGQIPQRNESYKLAIVLQVNSNITRTKIVAINNLITALSWWLLVGLSKVYHSFEFVALRIGRGILGEDIELEEFVVVHVNARHQCPKI